jgi:hypothetical protein
LSSDFAKKLTHLKFQARLGLSKGWQSPHRKVIGETKAWYIEPATKAFIASFPARYRAFLCPSLFAISAHL